MVLKVYWKAYIRHVCGGVFTLTLHRHKNRTYILTVINLPKNLTHTLVNVYPHNRAVSSAFDQHGFDPN